MGTNSAIEQHSIVSYSYFVFLDSTVLLESGRKYSGEVNAANQPHGNGTEFYQVRCYGITELRHKLSSVLLEFYFLQV